MLSIRTRKEEQIENLIDEILDKNISVETFQETAAKSLETAEYEKVNSLLLDYYNKKAGYDFQNSLKQQLKLMVNEKVLSKLDDTKDLEKSKDEMANEIGNEENVDEKTLDKAKKNLEDKNKDEKQKENQEYNLRAELMKQVYIEEFRKYSDLLYKLKERQAYDRNLTVGDKQGTELVLYEKYLMNLESSYKAYAGMNKLDEKVLNDNEEVKKLKEKLAYNVDKKETYIDDKVNKRLNNVKSLYERRQEVAKEISEILDNKSLKQNPVEFEKRMDYLQEEYRNLTYEMRIQDPTLDEYQEMIRIERENKEFAKRELGANEEVGFASGYSGNQKEIDEKMIQKSTEKKAVTIEQKDNVTLRNTVDELIRETTLLIDEDIDYDKAEEYLQSAEDMLGIYENQKNEAKGEQEKVSNEKLDKHMDKRISGKSDREIDNEEKNAKEADEPSEYEDPFDIRKEANATKVKEEDLDRKMKLKARLKKVNDEYKKMYHNQKEEERENQEFQRII